MSLHTSPNGPYVIQANTVNAEVLRQMLGSVTGQRSGIVGSGDLLVSAHGTPNMSVDIASGFAVIAGTQAAAQGSYNIYNDAATNVTIPASDPVNPRVDLVSAVIQDNQYGTVGDNVIFKVTTGTPSGSPVAPSAPASSLTLATVAVAANATTIVGGNITDARVQVAGLPSPYTAATRTYTTANASASATSWTANLSASNVASFSEPYTMIVTVLGNFGGSGATPALFLRVTDGAASDITLGGGMAFDQPGAAKHGGCGVIGKKQYAAGASASFTVDYQVSASVMNFTLGVKVEFVRGAV